MASTDVLKEVWFTLRESSTLEEKAAEAIENVVKFRERNPVVIATQFQPVVETEKPVQAPGEEVPQPAAELPTGINAVTGNRLTPEGRERIRQARLRRAEREAAARKAATRKKAMAKTVPFRRQLAKAS